MTRHFKNLIILGSIGFTLTIAFLIFMQKEHSFTTEDVAHSFRNKEYSGLVVQKYVDYDEHAFQKVIVKHEYGERTILFNQETGGVFNFIEVNDSIIKELDTLAVRIIRNNLDTLIIMKFD